MATNPTTPKKPANDDGFEVVQTSELKPFVDWNETPEIEGLVSNFREIDGEFGTQTVCDVGDFSVGITTALSRLQKYEGDYIRIRFEGMQESKKGREFKSFTILRRKPAPKK